ncbi:MAG TPA: hypothetical protein PK951_13135, partial [Chitinophagaceae bacterium]|nr:hypothetical protein [Chitinophagaceae bacterium]
MKKLLIAVIFLPVSVLGQNFHFSARVGMASYQGDLKSKSVSLSQPKLFLSIGARYDLTEHIMARSYLSFTGLRGDDKKGSPEMRQRNLNFQTKIFEWELTGQYS